MQILAWKREKCFVYTELYLFNVDQEYTYFSSQVICQLNRRVVAAETAAASQSGEAKSANESEITRLQTLLAEKENVIEQLEVSNLQVSHLLI